MSEEKSNKKIWLFLLPLGVFLLLTLLLMVPLLKDGYDPKHLPAAMLNKPFPSFSLPALDVNQGLLDKDKVLAKPGYKLVNVWATWCPTCAAEHEVLNQLAAQGVNIVGINYKDGLADARTWLAQRGNPYSSTIFDEKGGLGIDLGVYGAPETYVIDPQGIIIYRHVGAVTMKVWNEDLQPLMIGDAS
jgi:cytochrome c biogenesis protein CcmG/thiol:disulfide interchange protein DsbE|tara:strand:+ start:1468 stop:2031 length:564 start_codon:yes stop_codon:yes gene_type:complete